MANAGANTVSVRLGNGDGTFGAPTNFVTGTTPKSVAAADLSGDGNLDLVTANQSSSTVSVLLGTGTGSFGPKTRYPVCTSAHEVAVGSFNGDGRPDLAVACWDGSVDQRPARHRERRVRGGDVVRGRRSAALDRHA